MIFFKLTKTTFALISIFPYLCHDFKPNKGMEDWELDFKWLEARHKLKGILGLEALPDLQSALFLIGIQELGQIKEDYTKEEKRDLIHIATCRLLSYDGYYEFEGIDAEGWPHWKLLAPFPKTDLKEQERYLQVQVIKYLEDEG